MEYPAHLNYAPTHEWNLLQNGIATVGISDFAQDALGDVVFADLPKVGQAVTAGEAICTLESVKTSSEIYAPYSGTIVDINTALNSNSELINTSPYAEGWLFKIEVNGPVLHNLSAQDYQQQVEG